jgi:HEAT repeat protein
MDAEEIRALGGNRQAELRTRALKILKMIGKAHPSAKKRVLILLEKWITDSNPYLRRTTLLAVGDLFKNKPEVLLRFSEIGISDPSWEVRMATAKILEHLPAKHKQLKGMVRILAKDKTTIVNRSVGDMLAKIIRKGKKTQLMKKPLLRLIKEFAQSDDKNERKTAAFALRAIERKNSETLYILSEWSKENDVNLKWTCIYACKLLGKKRPAEVSDILSNITPEKGLDRIFNKTRKELEFPQSS